VLGYDIVHMRDGRRARLRRRDIGFIFQGASLLPTYSALENIDLALRLPGLGFFERRRRAKAALEAVGLSAWAGHMPENSAVASASGSRLRARWPCNRVWSWPTNRPAVSI